VRAYRFLCASLTFPSRQATPAPCWQPAPTLLRLDGGLFVKYRLAPDTLPLSVSAVMDGNYEGGRAKRGFDIPSGR